MHIRVLFLFLVATVLAGCGAPDSLADRAHADEQKIADLYKMDSASQSDLDAVNRDLKSARSQRLTPSELKALVQKRATIVKDIENEKEVKRLSHEYDLLVAEWERKHPGQRFQMLDANVF